MKMLQHKFFFFNLSSQREAICASLTVSLRGSCIILSDVQKSWWISYMKKTLFFKHKNNFSTIVLKKWLSKSHFRIGLFSLKDSFSHYWNKNKENIQQNKNKTILNLALQLLFHGLESSTPISNARSAWLSLLTSEWEASVQCWQVYRPQLLFSANPNFRYIVSVFVLCCVWWSSSIVPARKPSQAPWTDLYLNQEQISNNRQSIHCRPFQWFFWICSFLAGLASSF